MGAKKQIRQDFDLLGPMAPVLDEMEESLFVVSLGGRILFANKAAKKLLGYEKDESLPESIEKLLSEDKLTKFSAIKASPSSLLEEATWQSATFKTKNGATLYGALKVKSLPLGHEEKEAFFLFAKENLAKKGAFSQKEQLQSAKLASLFELSSGIAHEINNPLSIISGFSELIEENIQEHKETFIPKYPKLQSHLQRVKDAGERITNIVKHIKEFCQMSTGEHAPLRINDVVHRSFFLLEQQLINRGIALSLQLDGDNPAINGDMAALEHALMNIITNARDALTEKHQRKGGHLTVKTTHDNDYVSIEFKDDGTGIEKEALDKVFDPFFSTKETGEGSGLGLSICYGIINDHKGKISLENNALGGASVFIRLPLLK